MSFEVQFFIYPLQIFDNGLGIFQKLDFFDFQVKYMGLEGVTIESHLLLKPYFLAIYSLFLLKQHLKPAVFLFDNPTSNDSCLNLI